MCVVFDDEGLVPGPSNKIATNDWDEEQHTSLGMCVSNLKRTSLGPYCGAPACIEAKNLMQEPLAKRNLKRPKRTMRECGPGQTYKWVVPCYNMNKVSKPCTGYEKLKVVAIWAICKFFKYTKSDFKAFGVKTKISNCVSWFGCVKHV